MAITLEQVRAALDPEEPDYNKAAKNLGPEALPHLERLIVGDHSMLASKAAYLAGLIGTENSVPVLERAARHGDATVRIAAAAAMQHLPSAAASDLLLGLVDDPDVGVQKVAMRSVPENPSAVLAARVAGLMANSPAAAATPVKAKARAATAGGLKMGSGRGGSKKAASKKASKSASKAGGKKRAGKARK
jgi:hypothetical protein